MNNEKLQIYTARITQANRSELIVIMYELLLEDMNEAVDCMSQDNLEEYERKIKHAGKYINELIQSLDFAYPISYDLLQLYIFVNKQLVTAMIKKEISYVNSAIKIMQCLKIGFDEVAKRDESEPLMKNSQQLYAGLTYGRGMLNEQSIDPAYLNRGYKA